MRTTAARSGDVATRRTHFPLLSFGLAIALLASWLFFGAVLLNVPAAQHNACGSVWNSSSPAADGEDSSRIARTPLRARRRLVQSKHSEATEGPLRAAARLVETTRAAERNATLAREGAEKELARLISLRPQAYQSHLKMMLLKAAPSQAVSLEWVPAVFSSWGKFDPASRTFRSPPSWANRLLINRTEYQRINASWPHYVPNHMNEVGVFLSSIATTSSQTSPCLAKATSRK